MTPDQPASKKRRIRASRWAAIAVASAICATSALGATAAHAVDLQPAVGPELQVDDTTVESGGSSTITVTNAGVFANFSGTTLQFSGTSPATSHTLTWADNSACEATTVRVRLYPTSVLETPGWTASWGDSDYLADVLIFFTADPDACEGTGPSDPPPTDPTPTDPTPTDPTPTDPTPTDPTPTDPTPTDPTPTDPTPTDPTPTDPTPTDPTPTDPTPTDPTPTDPTPTNPTVPERPAAKNVLASTGSGDAGAISLSALLAILAGVGMLVFTRRSSPQPELHSI